MEPVSAGNIFGNDDLGRAPRQRPLELKWSGILPIIVGTIILTLMIALTTRSLL
jgi:hypothetical protein